MPFSAALRISAPAGAEGRVRAIATMTALGLALAGGPAWGAAPAKTQRTTQATEPGPVVMVWPGDDGAPVDRAEAALRAEGLAVVPLAPVREAVADHRAARAEGEQARQVRVEGALEASQAEYLDLDFDGAIATLHAVQDDALAVARPGRCEGLWELAFRHGLGRWAKLDEPDARVYFELAIALDPERRPLGELYGPDVTAAFLRAVQSRTARFTRSVPLRVTPADADVEIDCRPLEGRPPALLPGLHAVRVAAPGFQTQAHVADLRDGATIAVELQPLPSTHAPERRFADSTDADAVDDGSTSAHAIVLELARAHGAEAVLVVAHGEEGVRVRPWGSDGIGAAVERPALEAALRAALGLLRDDGRLRPPTPRVQAGPVDRPEPTPAPRSRKPVLRSWWFWTLVGSAVTGTALGLGLGLGMREPAPGRLVILAR